MSKKLRVSILLLSGLFTVHVGDVPIIGPTCLHAEEPSSATSSEWRLIGRLETAHGSLRHIAFSSDGNWLAAATARPHPEGGFHAPVQGAVILIETGKPKVVRIFQSEQFGSPDAVAFTDDNSSVVALWDYGTVMYWKRKNGQLEKTLNRPEEAGHAVQVLESAEIAAWSCDDGKTRIWSLPSQEERTVLQTGIFLHLALSPDAKRYAVARKVIRTGKSTFTIPIEEPGSAVIWNVDRRTVEATLTGHDKSIRSMAFSPDSSVIATGGQDGVVKLWQLPTGLPLLVDLKAHSNSVVGLAFSPDGKLLATGGGFDAEVKVWNARSGGLVTILRWTDEDDPSSMCVPIAFSSDGNLLAVGAEEGVVAFWSVPLTRRLQGSSETSHR